MEYQIRFFYKPLLVILFLLFSTITLAQQPNSASYTIVNNTGEPFKVTITPSPCIQSTAPLMVVTLDNGNSLNFNLTKKVVGSCKNADSGAYRTRFLVVKANEDATVILSMKIQDADKEGPRAIDPGYSVPEKGDIVITKKSLQGEVRRRQ